MKKDMQPVLKVLIAISGILLLIGCEKSNDFKGQRTDT
jgi:hypothetical protein